MDKDTADALTAFAREVAQLLVESLNLENRPENLDPEQALFGEGRGLDSSDVSRYTLYFPPALIKGIFTPCGLSWRKACRTVLRC